MGLPLSLSTTVNFTWIGPGADLETIQVCRKSSNMRPPNSIAAINNQKPVCLVERFRDV
jgi:hypothetical protein